MAKRPTSELPDDHRRCRGVFDGVTDDGMSFRLEVRQASRRLGSGELVRQQIRSMTRGRPMTSGDLYKDVVEISLFIPNRHRADIEILPSGMYRHGRHVERSLRAVVESMLDETAPRSGPRP